MKLAIYTDSLATKNHQTYMLNELGKFYQQADFLPVIHKMGAVHGEIERHRIYSTFLNFASEQSNFFNKFTFLIWNACNGRKLKNNYEHFFVFSQGIVNFDKNVDFKNSTIYLYDIVPFDGIVNKVFSSFLIDLQNKYFPKFKNFIVSSKVVGEKAKNLGWCENYNVVYPCFNLEDFSFSDFNQEFQPSYFILNGEMKIDQFEKLIEVLAAKNLNLKVLNANQQMKTAKVNSLVSFVDNGCDGDLSALIAYSHGLIDLTNSPFPKVPLACVSMGRPILIKDDLLNKEFFSNRDGIYYHQQDFQLEISTIINDFFKVNFKQLSEGNKKFSPQAFKARINQFISPKKVMIEL